MTYHTHKLVMGIIGGLLIVLACILLTGIAVADITFTDNVTALGSEGNINYYIIEEAGEEGWTDPHTYTALYEMETTNSVATLDTSGNDYHATNDPSVASGPAWTIVGTNEYGRVEHAYDFDGVDDGLIALVDSGYSATSGTIVSWCKVTPSFGDSPRPVVIYDLSASDNQFYMNFDWINSNRRNWDIYFEVGNTVQWRANTAVGSADASSNVWTHMAVVQDGVEPKLYINGVEQSLTFSTSTDKTQWLDDMFADASPPDRNWMGRGGNYDGLLDYVGIIPDALSSNEVLTLFQNTHPTNNLRIRD